MASSIDKLTEHYFEKTTCDKIEKHIARGKRCMIYFGDFDDLYTGGMKYLNDVASFDTLHFDDPLEYLVVQDPVCIEKFGFNPRRPTVGLCANDMKAQGFYR